ncbi:DedA family protein [Helicobacter monodelphidis]|uniref:DedA family protein n=1 Tax=Helicobacter sp. 15-1451 TaxID=2004995 RepID=UPI000DCC2F80|nr:DedA family protein [Helicobacter sp. 15-1451]RAX58135.1 DedA family protein [Helicobacter sp. 15-1451]
MLQKRITRFLRSYFLFIIAGVLIVGLFAYSYYSDFSFEEFITNLWENHLEDWGYLILFVWSLIEGELGLVFAGLAVHDGKMHFIPTIIIAGTAASIADQFYFYIGRFNRRGIQDKLSSQRRKFALASRLLQKYGWSIIFIQRFLYGMRTILPMSIGATRYSAIKFCIINLISSWIWASIAVGLTWYFGTEIFGIIDWFADNPFILIGIAVCFILGGWWLFHTQTQKKERK